MMKQLIDWLVFLLTKKTSAEIKREAGLSAYQCLRAESGTLATASKKELGTIALLFEHGQCLEETQIGLQATQELLKKLP